MLLHINIMICVNFSSTEIYFRMSPESTQMPNMLDWKLSFLFASYELHYLYLFLKE